MNDAAPAIRPVDLTGIEAAHPEGETAAQRIGVAADETAAGVTGVHHLGGSAARALDAASRAIRGTSTGPGVTVSEEQGGTVIDIDLVVEYPAPVQDVVDRTRAQVAHAARQIAPGPVRVNIRVTDVHGPFDDEQSPAGAALERAEDAGSDALEQAKAAGSDAADRVHEASVDAADRARDAGDRAGDTAREVGSELAGRARAVGAVLADSAKADVEDTREAAAERDADASTRDRSVEDDSTAADFDTYAEAGADDPDDPEVPLVVDERADGTTRVEVDGPAAVERP
ncbi:Asp23/Gls24 family envelope stress response protein [Clavibacter sp. Sh2126]|uniref:Asp23/Gls24 family envelope stress response protein n=1 Tax=Clavibacter sp. Sh2126 TaxID=3397678 RepID=UPI0039E1D482